MKLIIGNMANSEALRADGRNNFTDILASIAVLIGLRIRKARGRGASLWALEGRECRKLGDFFYHAFSRAAGSLQLHSFCG